MLLTNFNVLIILLTSMSNTKLFPNPIELIKQHYQNDPINLQTALDLHSSIITKYPFLTLQLKWGTPCYHFNNHNIFFLIIKNVFENKKFAKPQLFLGFINGYKLFHSKLFLESKLSNIKYINLTKLKQNKHSQILELIGNAIEI